VLTNSKNCVVVQPAWSSRPTPPKTNADRRSMRAQFVTLKPPWYGRQTPRGWPHAAPRGPQYRAARPRQCTSPALRVNAVSDASVVVSRPADGSSGTPRNARGFAFSPSPRYQPNRGHARVELQGRGDPAIRPPASNPGKCDLTRMLTGIRTNADNMPVDRGIRLGGTENVRAAARDALTRSRPEARCYGLHPSAQPHRG
jgi:hypothetical protein